MIPITAYRAVLLYGKKEPVYVKQEDFAKFQRESKDRVVSSWSVEDSNGQFITKGKIHKRVEAQRLGAVISKKTPPPTKTEEKYQSSFGLWEREDTPAQVGSRLPDGQKRYIDKEGNTYIDEASIMSYAPNQTPMPEKKPEDYKYYGKAQGKPSGHLSGLRYDVKQKEQKIRAESKKGFKEEQTPMEGIITQASLFGLGLAKSGIDQARFFSNVGKGVLKYGSKPVDTSKKLYGYGSSAVKKVSNRKGQKEIWETSKQSYKSFETKAGEVGPMLKSKPSESAGYFVGEIAGFKGVGAAGKVAGKTGKYVTQRAPFVKKPKTITPSKALEKSVEPYTRQRATLMLKTDKKKYVMGKTKSGQIISLGGGIEKGQSARKAVLAELGQETGLKAKDISNLKYKTKVVYPEETHHVFTADISHKAAKNIKPSSDVSKIVFVSPKKAKGVTGQSAYYPIEKGGIRAYELGIINKLETGTKPTWLYSSDKKGRVFLLGTQSRYDVPYKYQKEFLKQESLILAHGTPNAPRARYGSVGPKIGKATRRYQPIEKEFDIIPSKTKRGQAEGLYVQPPAGVGEQQYGYVGLSYTGIGARPSESLGLKWGFGRKTVLTAREKPKAPLIATPKTKAGTEVELLFKEGTFKTSGRANVVWMGNERLFLQPVKLKKNLAKIKNVGKEKPLPHVSSSGVYRDYKYVNPFTIGKSSLKYASIGSRVGSSFKRTPKSRGPSLSYNRLSLSKSKSILGNRGSSISGGYSRKRYGRSTYVSLSGGGYSGTSGGGGGTSGGGGGGGGGGGTGFSFVNPQFGKKKSNKLTNLNLAPRTTRYTPTITGILQGRSKKQRTKGLFTGFEIRRPT